MEKRLPIEFGVWEVKDRCGKLFVAGMCYESTLKAGDTVTSVYHLQPPAGISLVELAERSDIDFVISEQRNVNLIVEEITIYDRIVAEVPPGHTAVLRLSGEGMDLVRTKDVLGIKKDRG